MSKIDLQNYEAYYLDYLEGNLRPEDSAQLLLFLESNPHLKTDPEELRLTELKPAAGIEIEKGSLRKVIDESNVEEYIIASAEDEIETEDALELKEYVSRSPEAKVLAGRYRKTILSKPLIPFPEKHGLKKKDPVLYYLTPLTSAAAAILIFLWIAFPESANKNLPEGDQHATTKLPDSTGLGSPEGENVFVTQKIKSGKKERSEFSPEKQMSSVLKNKIAVKPEHAELSVADTSTRILNPPVAKLNTGITDGTMQENKTMIPELAVVDPDLVSGTDQKPAVKELTLAGLAKKVLKKEILKQENSDTASADEEGVFAAVVNKIDEKTKADISYTKETEDRTLFSISIGKFEFSRTKSR